MVTEYIAEMKAYHFSFPLHTITATTIKAIRATTPNVTPSPNETLGVSKVADWMVGTALSNSTVVEATKIGMEMLIVTYWWVSFRFIDLTMFNHLLRLLDVSL